MIQLNNRLHDRDNSKIEVQGDYYNVANGISVFFCTDKTMVCGIHFFVGGDSTYVGLKILSHILTNWNNDINNAVDYGDPGLIFMELYKLFKELDKTHGPFVCSRDVLAVSRINMCYGFNTEVRGDRGLPRAFILGDDAWDSSTTSKIIRDNTNSNLIVFRLKPKKQHEIRFDIADYFATPKEWAQAILEKGMIAPSGRRIDEELLTKDPNAMMQELVNCILPSTSLSMDSLKFSEAAKMCGMFLGEETPDELKTALSMMGAEVGTSATVDPPVMMVTRDIGLRRIMVKRPWKNPTIHTYSRDAFDGWLNNNTNTTVILDALKQQLADTIAQNIDGRIDTSNLRPTSWNSQGSIYGQPELHIEWDAGDGLTVDTDSIGATIRNTTVTYGKYDDIMEVSNGVVRKMFP